MAATKETGTGWSGYAITTATSSHAPRSRQLRRARPTTSAPESRAASTGALVMASVWPWLAVAGVGALHGLNPATGWMFAAAWGLRSHDRTQALWALLPIAVGHATSIALVAAAVALDLS